MMARTYGPALGRGQSVSLAALTLDPDGRFAELRGLYASDASLSVPPEVFNAVTQQTDRVAELATAPVA